MAGAAWIPIQALTKQRGCDQQDETLQHSRAACPCCWQGDWRCVTEVLFLPLGMKASRLVTRTQISSCHHLQAAVLAVQTGLLKILWQIKDTCICLLLYLFVDWACDFYLL